MAAYQSFHMKAGPRFAPATRCCPPATAVRSAAASTHHRHRRPVPRWRGSRRRFLPVRGREPRRRPVTARDVPAAKRGAVESGPSSTPWTPSGHVRRHLAGAAAGATGRGRRPRHTGVGGRNSAAPAVPLLRPAINRPGPALRAPATATTVRVRDGQVLLTDGPFAESAEIATGVYLLAAVIATRR